MLPYAVGTAITGGALLAGIGASASQLGTSVAAVACADGDCGNEASPIIMQGRTILTNPAEAVSQGLKKVAAEPGFYDIATHGTETSAKVWRNGKYITINADEFVEHILSGTGYQGGPIRLLSCNSACGLAAQVANRLGVTVRAPDGDLYVTKTGRMFINVCESGKWVNFP